MCKMNEFSRRHFYVPFGEFVHLHIIAITSFIFLDIHIDCPTISAGANASFSLTHA